LRQQPQRQSSALACGAPAGQSQPRAPRAWASGQPEDGSSEEDEEEFLEDLYELLGVPRDVELPELQKAYRRQCIRAHPDKGGDRRTFDNVMKAFEILSDSDLRRAYDARGHKGAEELRQGKQTIRGSIESILSFLESNTTVAERPALWTRCLLAIEDISRSDRDAKAWFLHADVLGRLAALFRRLPSLGWATGDRLGVLRGFVRCLRELCGGKPEPSPAQLHSAWDCFAQALADHGEDPELIAGALGGLAFVLQAAAACEDEEEEEDFRTTRLILGRLGAGEAGSVSPLWPCPVLERIVSCLRRPSERGEAVLGPALALLGSLVTTPGAEPTDAALGAGAAGALRDVLICDELGAAPRRAAAAALAAAAAHLQGAQARRLLEEPGLWDALCHTAESAAPRRLRHECVRAVASIAKHGPATLPQLDCQALFRLTALALGDAPGHPLLWAVLEAAEACLRPGSGVTSTPNGTRAAGGGQGTPGPLAQTAEDAGFLAGLQALLPELPKSSEVRRKAARILQACNPKDPWSDAVGCPKPQHGGA